jgi:hypothetical protein
MHRAKVLKWSMLVWVSELESETNSASGGGGWESAGNVPAAPGIGGSTLAASQWGGSMLWN